MSDEFNIPKSAQIALKTFLKMMGFQPEPVIAQIDQISQTVRDYKADQNEMKSKIDFIFEKLSQEQDHVAIHERERERNDVSRGDEQSQRTPHGA